jgi:hypothetical protein
MDIDYRENFEKSIYMSQLDRTLQYWMTLSDEYKKMLQGVLIIWDSLMKCANYVMRFTDICNIWLHLINWKLNLYLCLLAFFPNHDSFSY